jgi:hypothetical protein
MVGQRARGAKPHYNVGADGFCAIKQAMRDAHGTLWPREKELIVIRNNILYLIIGALVVAVAVLSYQLYQDRHQPEGVHIEVGPNGLSIDKK